MRDLAATDGAAWRAEWGVRARKLFAAVVLAALDDAITENRFGRHKDGVEQIARWARSRDGREVLTCAGIDPCERVVEGLMAFVRRGERTTKITKGEATNRGYWG